MEKIYSKLKRQEEINAKFNDLLKSGKMKLNISLEQSTKRRNIVIDDEFDEDDFSMYPILIQYGGGSEAQVYLHEILLK